MSDLPAFDHVIDCEGLLCPLPVLRARKRLAALVPGRVSTEVDAVFVLVSPESL